MAVPNIFAAATGSIPLSQLDANFNTAITIGNTAVYLGNTTTTLGNVTINNATLNSGTIASSMLPVGSIKQVVQHTFTTQSSTTSGTYANTIITGAITPASSSNKILVFVNSQLNSFTSGTGYGSWNIIRGSTQIVEWSKNEPSNVWVNATFNYLDSPATTSSTTYTVQHKLGSGSGTIYTGWGSGVTSTLILMEVVA